MDWIEKTSERLRFNIDKPGFRSAPLVIITSILNPKMVSKFELAELYDRRWHIELGLRNVKTTMNMDMDMDMDMLRRKTPSMVRKEIKMRILAYNLIRLMIVQAAFISDIDPRTISFKGALQMVIANLNNVSQAMVNIDRYISEWQAIKI